MLRSPDEISTDGDTTDQEIFLPAWRPVDLQSFLEWMGYLPIPVAFSLEDGRVIYFNPRFEEVLGYSLGDLPTMAQWWVKAYPDPLCREEALEHRRCAIEHAKATGQPIAPLVFAVQAKSGAALRLRIRSIPMQGGVLTTFEDLTEGFQANELLQFGQKILRLVAQGEALGTVLHSICLEMECRIPGALCSVLALDHQGLLRSVAGPHLPASWMSLIDGLQPGENVGACGAAAHTMQEVLSADIASDPAWQLFQEAAHSFGLASCWSIPIAGSDGACLGTIALYWREPRPVVEKTWRAILSTGVALVSVSMEKSHRQRLLDEMYFRLSQGEEAGDMGSWSWNAHTGRITISEHARRMLGVDTELECFAGNFLWGWVHPQDHNAVRSALSHMSQGVLPEPLLLRRHPDLGAVKYFKLTVKKYTDLSSEEVGFVGSMIDMTESTRQRQLLQAQLQELRQWQAVMLDREDRVQELKREVNQLLAVQGKPRRYSGI